MLIICQNPKINGEQIPQTRNTKKFAKKTTPSKRKAKDIPHGLMKDLYPITSFLSQQILMACHLTLNPSGIRPKLNSPKPLLRTQYINMPGVIDYDLNMKLEDKGINSLFIQQIPPLLQILMKKGKRKKTSPDYAIHAVRHFENCLAICFVSSGFNDYDCNYAATSCGPFNDRKKLALMALAEELCNEILLEKESRAEAVPVVKELEDDLNLS
ncbi:hypothetical protein CEXT_690261 [Caerostris extrusa]|uniref:Uncharacterized protein n=1 Tax=Caerostris extrusa TaxID=172846 RepID=A0AAV4W5R0_CAEEX|nr:hypothetical protein CEXT_690261 [Caerostris extrusa]